MTFRRARGALYMSLKVRILRIMSTWPGIFQGEPAFAVGGAHEVAPCAPPFLFAGRPGMSINVTLKFLNPLAANQLGNAGPQCQTDLGFCFPILGSPTTKVIS